MRKQIYIIIGNGGTGKSSLIRTLTGTYQGGRERVLLRNGERPFFRVWTTSSQEARHQPDIDLDQINNADEDFILMSLRYDEAYGCPNAQAYIDLIDQNHDIQAIVILGNHPLPIIRGNTQVDFIRDHDTRPINGNAEMIRRWWAWA